MIRSQLLARTLREILIPVAIMAAGIGSALAEELPFPPSKDKAARIVDAQVEDGLSRLTIAPAQRFDPSKNGIADDRSHLVALPRGTTSFQLQIDGPAGATVSAPDGLMIMRGQPVLRVVTTGTNEQMATITVSHNGHWGGSSDMDRLASAAMASALHESLPVESNSQSHGSYLIVFAPAFSGPAADMAQWKTLKGFTVRSVSTSETGASTDGIKDYIQNAYDTWDNPPEYILLVGDVDEIPTFNFHGNPSDQNYVQLEGDDFLMDAMIGRLPVENPTEAQTMVNKIIQYERRPELAGSDWQTRALMVAGVYASDTPGYTVKFCGEMLEDMGFPAPVTVSSPPLPSLHGSQIISNSLNAGVGMVVYRGWAYGTAGWDPPLFTVDNIPGLNSNNMTPIVMSFVCLNGDYTNSSPCFGEVFVRQGSPEEPGKGAVAFIGNGEHWSHTRYNDAMAISIFENITNEEVTDLGTLLNTGKFRFMDYFPNEMSADEFGEESVEFYFHIYNLLGDPSMKIWRELPREISVTHATNIAVGANSLLVSVLTADDSPVSGARVGIVQNGALIGTGITALDGTVDVDLVPVVSGSDISVTITENCIVPYEGTVTTGTAPVYLAVTSIQAEDNAGNSDLVINPGETLALTPSVHNHGSTGSGSFDLGITGITGPASIVPGTVNFADIAAGSEAAANSPLGISIAANAADGSVIRLQMDAERAGGQHDISAANLVVVAPAWEIVSLAPGDGGGSTLPGETTNLLLTLRNTGSIASAAGTADLTLLTAGASLGNSSAVIPACPPGQTVISETAFDISVEAATATNTNLTFDLVITTGQGYRTDTTSAVVVGPVDVSAPVGPDNYGYYAYDSADYDYPASRPVYSWHEISTEMGGPGTKLDFPIENEVVWMVVDLPFTFRYYGQDYTQVRVSDNGWISFDTGNDYDFYNWTIPTQYGVEALVAPFWDNLNPVAPEGVNSNGIDPDGIYTYHDETLEAFVVEWSRLPHYKPEILGMQTFQVALLDPATHSTASGDGEILFLYRQVNNNDHLRMYATVGIESPDGTDGLQLSYANINAAGMAPLQPGLAVRVTTEAPVRVPFAVSDMSARQTDGLVEIQWQTSDDRPVLGWHVDRLSDEGRVRLTESPLPAAARRFTDSSAGTDEGSRYLLTALHPYGVSSEPGAAAVETTSDISLALYPAHPNPARGSATIGFALPREGNVRLSVYDVAGRLVRTLVNGPAAAGEGVKIWDGKHDNGAQAAGGIYFYRLETGSQTLTRKMILVR